MWKMNDPEHMEKVLVFFCSHPSDDDDSDADMDQLEDPDPENQIKTRFESRPDIFPDLYSPEELMGNSIRTVDPSDVNVECESDSDDNEMVADWGMDTTYFEKLSVSFMKTPEILLNTSGNEASYFEQFLSSDIISTIVSQTKLYTIQNHSKNWKDTTDREIKALIGCFILMAIRDLPHFANYCSSNPLLRVETISQVITAKIFKRLSKI